MRTCCFILLMLSVVFRSSADNLANSGRLALKLMATTQGEVSVSERTNASGSVLTSVSKTAVTNLIFDSADLLALLENSYNTQFTKGSQLVVSLSTYDFSLYVADSTGRNVVFNPGGTFSIGTIPGAPQPIHSRTLTTVTKIRESGPIVAAANSTYAVTQTILFHYDDSSLATADGTHTKFDLTCVVVGKISVNLVTDNFKDAVKIKGVGSGMIRGQEVILDATGSANLSGKW